MMPIAQVMVTKPLICETFGFDFGTMFPPAKQKKPLVVNGFTKLFRAKKRNAQCSYFWLETGCAAEYIMSLIRQLLKCFFLLLILSASVYFWTFLRLKINYSAQTVYYTWLMNISDYNQSMAKSCKIPKLNPWDDSILHLLPSRKEQIKCSQVQEELLILSVDGQLSIKRKFAEKYPDLQCQYQCFDKKDGGDGQSYIVYGSWTKIAKTESVKPGCEFFEAQCLESNNKMFWNLYSQIIPRQPLQKSSRNKAAASGNISVVLFVIDSILNP